ncbi:MAG TPA: VOC family protein [Ardenticatenaceae bacterium]|nr:VOC family protein [Ardenticatenaceae bacterium]
MAKLDGIGGIFIYANDPDALSQWYARHFDLDFIYNEGESTYYLEFQYRDDDDPSKRKSTVFAIYPAVDELGPSRREFMLNFRVTDLDGLLEQLKAAGVRTGHIEAYEYGRFSWIKDPEGNRLELWEPA